MGQSSTTYTLVAHLMEYLESYLPTSVYNEMGSLWQRVEKWREMNLWGGAQKDTMSLKKCVGAPETWFILTFLRQ
jgi:hypothetical protein